MSRKNPYRDGGADDILQTCEGTDALLVKGDSLPVKDQLKALVVEHRSEDGYSRGENVMTWSVN